MAKVASIKVEVKPTITEDSALACVVLLNLFLEWNDEYAVHVTDDGKLKLVDRAEYSVRPLTDEEQQFIKRVSGFPTDEE